jgi:hypothetical protein
MIRLKSVTAGLSEAAGCAIADAAITLIGELDRTVV